MWACRTPAEPGPSNRRPLERNGINTEPSEPRCQRKPNSKGSDDAQPQVSKHPPLVRQTNATLGLTSFIRATNMIRCRCNERQSLVFHGAGLYRASFLPA